MDWRGRNSRLREGHMNIRHPEVRYFFSVGIGTPSRLIVRSCRVPRSASNFVDPLWPGRVLIHAGQEGQAPSVIDVPVDVGLDGAPEMGESAITVAVGQTS